MRRAFLFLVASTLVAGSEELVEAQNAEHQCRSGFDYYLGWCTALSPSLLSFSGAVDYCSRLAAYSPSIHSRNDLEWWSGSAFDLAPRFWLDASCPEAGLPNKWRDGTPTDYMGPTGELQSCTPNYGFVMTSNGFANETYADLNQASAFRRELQPALCVYPVDPMPEPAPIDGNERYCQCNESAIELDIVFAADTSNTITADNMTSLTQSLLYKLPLGTSAHQSNVATIAFGDDVKVVSNFGDLRNNDDIRRLTIPSLGGHNPNLDGAIDQASSMLESTTRQNTRKIIVLLSKSVNSFNYTAAKREASKFTNSGGIFIVIDYANDNTALGALSSAGYYFKAAASTTKIMESFCDANCICPSYLIPYLVPNVNGRDLPMGCFRVSDTPSDYNDASQDCRVQNGFVATIHDDDKNFFLISLFPVKARHWIGLRQIGSQFVWADGSNDGFTWWASGNPVDGLSCVYAAQTVGFNTGWFSAPCSDPQYSLLYACQTRPYDAGYSGTA